MSRIGKKPVKIPDKVQVRISGREVTVESGGKSLSMTHRPEVRVAWDESEKQVAVSVDESSVGAGGAKRARALWGTTRALIENMVVGVTKGYEKQLEIVGVGWGAEHKGKSLGLKLGFANVVSVDIPAGVDVKVDGQKLTVTGPDKQAVGQFAAMVRAKRKPEPYNGKGIRYVGEAVRRKTGKQFGS